MALIRIEFLREPTTFDLFLAYLAPANELPILQMGYQLYNRLRSEYEQQSNNRIE